MSHCFRPLLFLTVTLLFSLPGCSDQVSHSESTANNNSPTYPLSFADENYPPVIPISEQLQSMIDELETTSLAEKETVNEIPMFLRIFLDSLTSGFSMANPGENWQEGCIVEHIWITRKEYDPKTGDSVLVSTQDMSQPLPSRQMIYFGLGENIALMSYYTGSWGKCAHMMIIRFERYQVTDYWHGYGEDSIENKAAIIKYLKSEHAMHRKVDNRLTYP